MSVFFEQKTHAQINHKVTSLFTRTNLNQFRWEDKFILTNLELGEYFQQLFLNF